MAFKIPTVFFLFCFYFLFLSNQLQPTFARPTRSQPVSEIEEGWYDVYFDKDEGTTIPAPSASSAKDPAVAQADLIDGRTRTSVDNLLENLEKRRNEAKELASKEVGPAGKTEDPAPGASSVTNAAVGKLGAKKESIDTTVTNDAAATETTEDTSTGLASKEVAPADKTEDAAEPAAAANEPSSGSTKWLDNLVAASPGFSTFSPWGIRRILGTALHLFGDESASHKELATFLGGQKSEISLESLNTIMSGLSQAGYRTDILRYTRGELLGGADARVAQFLASANVKDNSGQEIFGPTSKKNEHTQSLELKNEYEFLWTTPFTPNVKAKKPFQTLEGKSINAVFVEGDVNVKSVQSDQYQAVELGLQGTSDLHAYLIQTASGKLTSDIYDNLMSEMAKASPGTKKVSFPSFRGSGSYIYDVKAFPKLFGTNNADATALGTSNAGALGEEDNFCVGSKGGSFSSIVVLALDPNALKEEIKVKKFPDNPAMTIAKGNDLVFDKPFYLVVHDSKSNTVLQMHRVGKFDTLSLNCEEVKVEEEEEEDD